MELIGFIVAIAISYFLGPYISSLLDRATQDIQLVNPNGISEEDWKSFVRPEGRDEAGRWVGVFERVLAFFSFYSGAHAILGGWLALKVASKWQVWATVIKMPDKLENANAMSYLRARQRWGSWLHTRFLIGTILNVLVGFILAAALMKVVVWF